jgi:hypothetical protein
VIIGKRHSEAANDLQEPLEFNNYLRDVAARCKGKRQRDFWERLVEEQLTLINQDEEPDR